MRFLLSRPRPCRYFAIDAAAGLIGVEDRMKNTPRGLITPPEPFPLNATSTAIIIDIVRSLVPAPGGTAAAAAALR